ncbi:MAG TPA: HAMP domain-containing sensor histidine kinase [Gammaproteobacteria bacterium]|nr:HAMP domain-containing sensor histidine kinase [Gammaproteobacteria bacterium]
MRLPAIIRTSVFQLTILYVGLFGVSVATLGWFIYRSTVGYLENQTDEVIEAEINGLAEQFFQLQRERGLEGGVRGLAQIIQSRRERTGTAGERFSYLLIDQNLRPLAGNLNRWPAPSDMVEGWIEFSVPDPNAADAQVPVRARILPIRPFELTGIRVLVGREIRELEQINDRFLRALTLGLGLTMLLALGGGLALAFSAQRHVAELSRTTRRIIAGDLSQRVPVGGAHDEHAELARSVNTMLDQIENLMAGLRHVGDSIAHDLRGPLTRLRNRLENLSDEDTPSRASIAECLAQADRVLATFNALLRIARIESGAYRKAFATIDLGPIVDDIADLYEATAEDKLVELRRKTIDDAFVFGDRELLAQALTNLLDNAVKHTPPGGHIDLELRRHEGTIHLVVADSGPGVPAESRERVLQRFARLDESRSTPGSGLGLALVRAVADQHDAKLVLTDNGPGLRVTLTLPATGSPRAES